MRATTIAAVLILATWPSLRLLRGTAEAAQHSTDTVLPNLVPSVFRSNFAYLSNLNTHYEYFIHLNHFFIDVYVFEGGKCRSKYIDGSALFIS